MVVKRALYSGDAGEAIDGLAREIGPEALSIARSMLGNRHDAEDALQDAFAQALRALPGFRGESSLRIWFIRILVNSCIRRRRSLQRWALRNEAAAGEAEGEHLDASGDPGLRGRLEKAVALLPHRQRTAFVLRFVHGLGMAEIAEVMGCAEGTVKATLHKARAKLCAELGDLTGGKP